MPFEYRDCKVPKNAMNCLPAKVLQVHSPLISDPQKGLFYDLRIKEFPSLPRLDSPAGL